MNMLTNDYCFYADKNLIGAKIKECRIKLGLTAEELANKLMYTTKNINKWEQGKGLPRPETIIDLCNLFQISPDDLLLPKSKFGDSFRFINFDENFPQDGTDSWIVSSTLYSPEIEIVGNVVKSPKNCFKRLEEVKEWINKVDDYKEPNYVFDRFDYLCQKFVFSWLTKSENVEFENYCYFVFSPSNYLLKQYKLDKSISPLLFKKYLRTYFNEKYGTDYKSRIESLDKDELMFEFYKLINKEYGKIDSNTHVRPGINALTKFPLFVSCKELNEHIGVFVDCLNQLEKDTLLTALESFTGKTYNELKKKLISSGACLVLPFINKTTINDDDYHSFETIYESILDKVVTCSYEEYLDLRLKGDK